MIFHVIYPLNLILQYYLPLKDEVPASDQILASRGSKSFACPALKIKVKVRIYEFRLTEELVLSQ